MNHSTSVASRTNIGVSSELLVIYRIFQVYLALLGWDSLGEWFAGFCCEFNHKNFTSSMLSASVQLELTQIWNISHAGSVSFLYLSV